MFDFLLRRLFQVRNLLPVEDDLSREMENSKGANFTAGDS